MGYAWPAFWLATPVLFTRCCPMRPGPVAALLAENLCLCWFPYLLGSVDSTDPMLVLTAFGGAMEDMVSRDFLQLIQAIVTQVALHRNAKDSETYPGRTPRNAAGMKMRAMASHAMVLVYSRPVVF